MARDLAKRKDGRHGGVSICDGCNDVHVRWGEWTVSLDRAAFDELSRMLGEAASALGAHGKSPDLAGKEVPRWTH
ncbi:MAG: hypothetical protein HY923_03460 [Elusimicrobia bacterium]|nr:hypothetical protein [Elusimicrobiota bacterium]